MSIWQVKGRNIELNDGPYVMGILNVTPDSFSDGGKFNSLDKALTHAASMVKDGAFIIDVGGESTRPGYEMISDDEEISRIYPVIEKITKEMDVLVSVDTYKSKVAKAALEAGAHIVNDIHGFRYDPEIAKVTASYDAGAILMANFKDKPESYDVIKYMNECYSKSMEIAGDAGVKDSAILLDPGVGFGTTREEDMRLIKDIVNHDRILLGASRKRVVASLLTRETVASERVAGSVGVALAGALNGAKIVRVHDVQETCDALRTFMNLKGV